MTVFFAELALWLGGIAPTTGGIPHREPGLLRTFRIGPGQPSPSRCFLPTGHPRRGCRGRRLRTLVWEGRPGRRWQIELCLASTPTVAEVCLRRGRCAARRRSIFSADRRGDPHGLSAAPAVPPLPCGRIGSMKDRPRRQTSRIPRRGMDLRHVPRPDHLHGRFRREYRPPLAPGTGPPLPIAVGKPGE
jgi:hypothetical protein